MTTDSRNEPKGIGGWLILVALNLVVVPIFQAVSLVDTLPVFAPEIWTALTQPGSATYSPWWQPLIVFEMVSGVALILFTVWVAWLFFTKSRRAPKLVIVWLACSALLPLLSLVGLTQIPAAEITGQGVVDLLRPTIFAAIWIAYFLRSKRVRNTFVEPAEPKASAQSAAP